MTAPMIEKRIRPNNIHAPQTRLICVENTHNRAGGRVFPVETMKQVAELAAEHGLRIHLDGARQIPHGLFALAQAEASQPTAGVGQG